jgi:hypothetical protein
MPDGIPCPSVITGPETGSAALLVILPGQDPGYDGGGDLPPGN